VPAVEKNRQSAPASVAPAAKFFIVHRLLIFLFSQAAGDIQNNIKKNTTNLLLFIDRYHSKQSITTCSTTK
jgi:hypothetical protein